MSVTVYPKTATKANSGKVYAFGRREELNGRPTSEGGYAVFRLCENYNSQVRGGLVRTWRYVKMNLSFPEAVSLMNIRCGYKAFEG